MKYNFNLNQYAVVANNLDLDVIDLCVFDAFRDLANSNLCQKKMDDGRVYFWIDYGVVISNAPLLGLTNKDSVYRRMKKLEAAGVIAFHNDNQKIRKTFFCWGAAYDILVFTKVEDGGQSSDNNPSQYGQSSVPVRTVIRTKYGQSSVLSTDSHPYDNTINDNYTNNTINDNSIPKNDVFARPNENIKPILPKKKKEKKDTPAPAAPRQLKSEKGIVNLPENYTGVAMDLFNATLEAETETGRNMAGSYNWGQAVGRDFAAVKKIVEMVSFAVVEKEYTKTATINGIKAAVTISPEKITEAVKVYLKGAFNYFHKIAEEKGGGVMFTPTSCQRNFNNVLCSIVSGCKTNPAISAPKLNITTRAVNSARPLDRTEKQAF
jgi:hypothetical protein